MRKQLKNILLIIERLPEDDETLCWAISLAQRHGTRLILGEVLGHLPKDERAIGADMFPPDLRAAYVRKRLESLERLVATVRQKRVEVKGILLLGESRAEILSEVEKTECDLLVLTVSSAKGFSDRISDHLWERFARGCSCPIMAKRMDAPKRYERVLAVLCESTNTVDGKPGGLDHKIMDTAITLARLEEATPHVLCTWRLPGEYAFRPYAGVTERQIDYLISQTKAVHAIRLLKTLDPYKSDVDYRNVSLLKGKRVDMICQAVRERKIDLIVMGPDSRFRVGSLFAGNTPRVISRRTDASLAVVSNRHFLMSPNGKRRASLRSIERLKSLVELAKGGPECGG